MGESDEGMRKSDEELLEDLERRLANCRGKEEMKGCMETYLLARRVGDRRPNPGDKEKLDIGFGSHEHTRDFHREHKELVDGILKILNDLGMIDHYDNIVSKKGKYTSAEAVFAEIRADRAKQEKRGEYPLSGPPDDE